MNITSYIADKIKRTLFKEASKNNRINPEEWLMFNPGGVECEVGEFLYGLVRMIKPDTILETGTHKGISACYMGLALKENNNGTLISLEFQDYLADEALATLNLLKVNKRIIIYRVSSLEFKIEERQLDLLFLDTEPDLRFKEFVRFYDNVKPGGFILIHDLNIDLGLSGTKLHGMDNWPFGDFRKYFGDKILDHELQVINFFTPRGFTLFQKAHGDFTSYKFLKGEL